MSEPVLLEDLVIIKSAREWSSLLQAQQMFIADALTQHNKIITDLRALEVSGSWADAVRNELRRMHEDGLKCLNLAHNIPAVQGDFLSWANGAITVVNDKQIAIKAEWLVTTFGKLFREYNPAINKGVTGRALINACYNLLQILDLKEYADIQIEIIAGEQKSKGTKPPLLR